MWAKHDPHLFYLSCFLLFVSEGALLIFRFFTAGLDTTLFWPSVGIGFWHRTFRAFLWWPEHGIGFCGPADSVAIMLNAVSPWFCIGDSKHRFGGPSMVSGFYGPLDGEVVMLNAVSP